MNKERAKLRHPIRAIREPFGKAGLVVAMIALVAALGGSALAAKGALTGKQKKEVEKIAKRAGKPGAPGAAGANGANGTNGKDGAAGTNGTNGTNGASAEAFSFVGAKTVGSVTCTEGGIEVKSAKPTVLVCNGEEGTAGTNGIDAKATSFSGNEHGCIEGGVEVESAEPTVFVCNGNPWTAGGTLPHGSTETGFFARTQHTKNQWYEPISFPIPLAASIEEASRHLIWVNGEEFVEYENFAEGTVKTQPSAQCKGTPEDPSAEPGNLCVYLQSIGSNNGARFRGFGFRSKAGTFMTWNSLVNTVDNEFAGTQIFGTWAVTAP